MSYLTRARTLCVVARARALSLSLTHTHTHTLCVVALSPSLSLSDPLSHCVLLRRASAPSTRRCCAPPQNYRIARYARAAGGRRECGRVCGKGKGLVQHTHTHTHTHTQGRTKSTSTDIGMPLLPHTPVADSSAHRRCLLRVSEEKAAKQLARAWRKGCLLQAPWMLW